MKSVPKYITKIVPFGKLKPKDKILVSFGVVEVESVKIEKLTATVTTEGGYVLKWHLSNWPMKAILNPEYKGA